jgi:hypothetical protein
MVDSQREPSQPQSACSNLTLFGAGEISRSQHAHIEELAKTYWHAKTLQNDTL